VMDATRQVLHAAGARVDWIEADAGLDAAQRFGDPLPELTLALIRKHRVALKGPCTTPVGKGFRSINVRLRQGLDLYASVRPVRTLPGVKSPYSGVNLVVVRENTEGLYAGQEHYVVPGVVESLRVVTKPAAERIVRFAFELARREGRRRVTFCHKADVLRLSDGLFLECARRVADEFPFIDFEERRIDNLCMELVLHPDRFDVLVMENLFGDVISDLCAGLVGGLEIRHRLPGKSLRTSRIDGEGSWLNGSCSFRAGGPASTRNWPSAAFWGRPGSIWIGKCSRPDRPPSIWACRRSPAKCSTP